MIVQSNTVSTPALPFARANRGKSISQDAGAPGAQPSLTAPEQLPVSNTNLTAAGSSITDEDSAKQSTEAASRMMLAQAQTALSAQANLKPQSALRLLQQ